MFFHSKTNFVVGFNGVFMGFDLSIQDVAVQKSITYRLGR